MRVMYIQPAEGFGGAERQGVMHIRRLPAYGVSLLPIVGPGQPILQELSRAGVRDWIAGETFPHKTAEPGGVWARWRQRLAVARAYFATRRMLLREARMFKPDVIVANRAFGWAVAAPVASALGIPYVVRSGSRTTSHSERVALRLLRKIWGAPAAALYNCNAVKDSIAPLLDCPSVMLPNGIDTLRFSPTIDASAMRKSLGVSSDVRIVGMAVRPAPGKGLEFLAEVTANLTDPRALVLIAGDFGWRPYYENYFRERGLSQRVRFLGHISDVAAFYAMCDVAILTSRSASIEGSPNSVLEAMASGRPIVACDVGGVSEIVTHGSEGFLVDENDSTSFAGHLDQLLASDILCRRMGNAGRRTILARYSEQRSVEVMMGSIEAAVGRCLVVHGPRARRRLGVAHHAMP